MGGHDALILTAAYVAAMFAGAAWVQRQRERRGTLPYRLPAYALALAIYCTSWTFFGAVGSAATDGWAYLPIYVGPIALFLFAPRFLQKLVATVQAEGASSISDFIGSRFNKSRGVAALVTMIALFGTVPYLALQLRSVGISFSLIAPAIPVDTAIGGAAVLLAIFAILFGTRHHEVSGRSDPILYAVAAESILKLLALIVVAGLAIFLLYNAPAPIRLDAWHRLSANFAPQRLSFDFPVMTLVSLLAFLCLPRQFYVAILGASKPEDIVRARLPFIAYLAAAVIAVPPIAAAGMAFLAPDARPDFFVLSLPLQVGQRMLALIVFFGGLSAAVAMGIAETIALSTMVSNDLVAPFVLKSRVRDDINVGRIMLIVRRLAIVVLMGGAVAYAMLIPNTVQLASVGLIAFVALAQSAPALIMATTRAANDDVAAKAGLVTGFLLWSYTLFLPSLGILPDGLAGTLADPTHLFGIGQMSAVTHGTLWSLGGNLLAFALVSARGVRAPGFAIDIRRQRGVAQVATIGQLADMVARFTSDAEPLDFLGSDPDAPVDRRAARAAERLIAGVIGVSSARAIMASALSGASIRIGDVARLLDASGHSFRFSQGLLAATLEHIEPGVSVVDRQLRLIAWNSQYLDLFNYPPGMVHIGVPVAELIRFNAEQGECGPGEIEGHVARRLAHMRDGHAHSFERQRPGGRVIKTVGGPMPDGGYVMCFLDITAESEARAALERARAELEQRVEARTAELSDANVRLAQATADKTRFLAAASHDLLQPLHAARLFAAALKRDLPDASQPMLDRIDKSIVSANDLLRALLDISKLDAGGVVPSPTRFSLHDLLAELVDSFEPLARERDLSLRCGPGDALVETDRTLLRSILQNFLSNAVRYTGSGGVLIGVRQRGGRARIEVYDTGPGIPADKRAAIFREFERLGTNRESGIGLGLAIVERTARLIEADVALTSTVGRGSCFAVELPIAAGPDMPRAEPGRTAIWPTASRRILVLDDEPGICDGMAALLGRMGHRISVHASIDAALGADGPFDAALVDFDLGEARDGIDVIDALRLRFPALPAALITAAKDHMLAGRAASRGVAVLEKPLAPAVLADWLARPEAGARQRRVRRAVRSVEVT